MASGSVGGTAPELNDLIPGIKDGDHEYHHSAWSSTESLARHIGDHSPTNAWHDAGWEKEYGEGWNGTKTMGEALDLAMYGWKEGVEKIERALKYIQAVNPILKQPKKYGIAGTTPDVARAIAGNPLNMRVPSDVKNKRHPVITIISNMSVNCSVDADPISNRAAVTAALIDHIEAQGFSCEVIVMADSWDYSKFKAYTSVVVKRSNHPVDLNRLSFALGHASMFRRLIFADWGLSKECEPLGRGLGFHNKEIAPSQEQNEKGIFVLPSIQRNHEKFKNEDTASKEGTKWLISLLREQGCPAFPKMSQDEWDELKKQKEDREFIGFDEDDDD